MAWLRWCLRGRVGAGLLGLLGLLWLGGCKSFDDVPAKDCGKVVSHARKLLGTQADPAAKMMADCKAADSQDRGCAMAADSAADLLRCAM